MRLASTARLDAWPEIEVLVTHAGVTRRECSLLGLGGTVAPSEIARALNDLLDSRVERVRGDWARGDWTPLDLAPVHLAGVTRREGGGLLFHRAGAPATDGDGWKFDKRHPRRFDPRALPRGLVQVCGHTAHRKSWEDLAPGWLAEEMPDREHDGLRRLTVRGDVVEYVWWNDERPPVDADTATLILIDAGMHRSSDEEYPLLALRDS